MILLQILHPLLLLIASSIRLSALFSFIFLQLNSLVDGHFSYKGKIESELLLICLFPVVFKLQSMSQGQCTSDGVISIFSALWKVQFSLYCGERLSAAHKPDETVVNEVGHWRLDLWRSALKHATPFFPNWSKCYIYRLRQPIIQRIIQRVNRRIMISLASA